MHNVYRNRVDERYCAAEANIVRWRHTVRFVSASRLAGSPLTSGLDLGDRTPVVDELEQIFGCTFGSSEGDLDVDSLFGRHDVVTAFEVLEHLFNPLHALLEVRRVLSGPHSRLFVSVPAAKPAILASPDHFHEMSPAAAESLFARAGFRIVRRDVFRIRTWRFYLGGFKPLLRALFEKVLIYELEQS